MYAKADYHDCHYEGVDEQAYRDSVEFLSDHLEPGKRILDYGCGTGSFLCACVDRGYIAFGVDFDADVASAAGARAKCRSASVDDFEHMAETDFDAIHLGDVLEHLANPAATISLLLERLKPGGLLYVEGPIETNASPVHWAARLFGMVKKALQPTFVAGFAPTHLLRTDAAAQAQFFSWMDDGLRLVAWKLEETGWPYASGGLLKRLIASLAIRLGGRQILGVQFGNRFKAVLMKP